MSESDHSLNRDAEPPAETAETAPAPGPMPTPDAEALRARVVEALCQVYDPEIPVNIYELGLIYDLGVSPDGFVAIEMTLTSPMCPVAESLPGEVEMRVNEVEGVAGVAVEITWDPPWTPDMMSEAARLELGLM